MYFLILILISKIFWIYFSEDPLKHSAYSFWVVQNSIMGIEQNRPENHQKEQTAAGWIVAQVIVQPLLFRWGAISRGWKENQIRRKCRQDQGEMDGLKVRWMMWWIGRLWWWVVADWDMSWTVREAGSVSGSGTAVVVRGIGLLRRFIMQVRCGSRCAKLMRMINS